MEHDLKQADYLSLMFIFTLVESRTHVDTVENVLCGITNSRHICWSHTTCHICERKFSSSANLKIHIRRHEGVKPYVCCECLKSFCTAFEMKSHVIMHSDIKHFCCGLCGKYFKHKSSVKLHFKRCSNGCSDNLVGLFSNV